MKTIINPKIPGFKALVDGPILKEHRTTLEIGPMKNPNKNPVAERANTRTGKRTPPSRLPQ